MKTPLLASFALLAAIAPAQSSVSALSRVHAIVDARVEIGDGQVIERATIVIKDGVIVALGQDAAVPKGAEVLAGKGLTVYPGFIDAYTTRGVKTPTIVNKQDDSEPMSEVATAFMREANRKQVHPEVEARQYLDLGDDVRKPYWEAGFTTIMAVPSGNGLRGQGTLVNLSGRAAREAVIVAKTGQTLSFGYEGADSSYPVSLLGSIAQFKQVILDAKWQSGIRQQPGGPRAYSDPVLETLANALEGKTPFFLEADSTADIDRSVRLQSDLGISTILVGALQGWKRPQRLGEAGKLILALAPEDEPKLPEPKREEAKPEAAKADEKKDDVSPDDPTIDPDDPLRIEERRRLIKEAISNPGSLAKAGVKFAFTTKGPKDLPAFLAALRRAVAAGLPRDAALRALTVDAAALYGVSGQLGTLAVGKQATLTVRTGDFLDEKTKVKMVYVDGYRLDPTARPNTSSPRIGAGREER